ncbi:MAG: class E sortase [Actinophytocola sp.]|nr:class E sortase [Actinophytocola sp.]
MRTLGELFVTVGVFILLFVVYTLYVTDWNAAKLQDEATVELEESWDAKPEPGSAPAVGMAFTKLYIPRFGDDFEFTVMEGAGKEQLDVGPGHYPDTALPGEPGNFGVAGHRIGKGAPFNRLDEMKSCDAIVIETGHDFFVYRVLPMSEEIVGWEVTSRSDKRCEKVPTLRTAEDGGGPYGKTVGRRIVTPDRRDAVSPVPYRPEAGLPRAEQAALITLTTCHPEYGNSERMIIHAVLTNQVSKASVANYGDLLEKMGGS